MAAADDLFQLISSLTPSEKRYFKIHAKTHVAGKYKNNYEKLFDALNYWPEEEEYDEKLFKRKHKGKTFLKNLSVEKNYLYGLIMETMRSFHNKNDIDRRISDLLLDEEFFTKKRLNDQRKKTIDEGKALAHKYEELPALLMFMSKEATMRKEWKQEVLHQLADSSNAEEEGILDILNTLSALRYFSNKLFVHVRMRRVDGQEDLQNMSDAIIADVRVRSYSVGKSFWCDFHYYRIHAMHSRLKKDMYSYESYSRSIFELLEHHSHQSERDPSGYKIALYNYLNACFSSGNLAVFPPLLKKARTLVPVTKDEEGEDWQNLIHLELLYLSNTAKLEEAIALAAEVERGLIYYKKKVNKSRRLAILYNLAAAFFLKGDWLGALGYYNKIVLDKTDARQDLKEKADLLILACQYEMNSHDLLDYLIRNAQRRVSHHSTRNITTIYFKYLHNLLKGENIFWRVWRWNY